MTTLTHRLLCAVFVDKEIGDLVERLNLGRMCVCVYYITIAIMTSTSLFTILTAR